MKTGHWLYLMGTALLGLSLAAPLGAAESSTERQMKTLRQELQKEGLKEATQAQLMEQARLAVEAGGSGQEVRRLVKQSLQLGGEEAATAALERYREMVREGMDEHEARLAALRLAEERQEQKQARTRKQATVREPAEDPLHKALEEKRQERRQERQRLDEERQEQVREERRDQGEGLSGPGSDGEPGGAGPGGPSGPTDPGTGEGHHGGR